MAIVSTGEVTIIDVNDGITPVYAAITNPVFTFTAASDGSVSVYTNSGTDIYVYEGTNILIYDGVGTSAGTWKVTATGTSITPNASPSDQGSFVRYGDHSAITADAAKISYAIAGKNALGKAFSLTVEQAFSKAKAGAAGSPASFYELVLDTDVLAKSASGTYTPGSLGISANLVTGSTKTTYSGRFKIYENGSATASYTSSADESTKSYTITSTVTSSVKVELYAAGGTTTLLDAQTIPLVESGSSSITITVANNNYSIPALSTGEVASYVESGTTITVKEGNTPLTYIATLGTNVSSFTIGTPTISVTNGITVGNISDASNGTTTATILAHSGMGDTVKTITITYPITYKRANGGQAVENVTQTITKTTEGVRGSRTIYASDAAYTSTYDYDGAGTTAAGAASYAKKATDLINAATVGSSPRSPIEGDTVTFSNNSNYVYTVTYKASTSTWDPPGTVIDGNLLVTGSVIADKIDTRGLSIKDSNGNTILAAGSALDFANVGGATKPANNATKNVTYVQSTIPSFANSGDLWYCTADASIHALFGTTGIDVVDASPYQFIDAASSSSNSRDEIIVPFSLANAVFKKSGNVLYILRNSEAALSGISVYRSTTAPASNDRIWFTDGYATVDSLYLSGNNTTLTAYTTLPTETIVPTILTGYYKASTLYRSNGYSWTSVSTANFISSGLLSNRLTGANGDFYFATDTNILYQKMNGSWQSTSTSGAPAGTFVNGVPVADITTAVSDFNSSNNRNSAVVTSPTIATDGSALDHTLQANGSADISFEWSWSGSEGDIDGFIVYVYQSASSSEYSFGTKSAEETAYIVPANKRAFILYGVIPNSYYTFGVRAYRSVDKDINSNGVIQSSIVKSSVADENPFRPSTSVAFSGNVTGTINNIPATDVNVWSAVSGAGKPADGATSGSNLVRKPTFGDGSIGTWGNGVKMPEAYGSLGPLNGYGELRCFERDTYGGHTILVTPGETIFCSSYVWSGQSTYGGNVGLAFKNASGNFIDWRGAGYGPGQDWHRVAKSVVVPSTAVSAEPWLQIDSTNGAIVPYVAFSDIYIGRQEQGATVGAPAGTYVGGTLAETVASNAANALSGLQNKLNKAGDTITGRIDMAVADGLFAGTDLNNGVYLGNGGLVGKKAGATTFAIDTAGNATFGGVLNAASGTFAGSLSAAAGTFSGTLTANAIDAVNTINIAGQAVTIPIAASSSSTTLSSALTSASIALTENIPIHVSAIFDQFYSAFANYYIYRNGIQIAKSQTYCYTDLVVPVSLVVLDTPGIGTHTYTLGFQPLAGTNAGSATKKTVLTLLAVKR